MMNQSNVGLLVVSVLVGLLLVAVNVFWINNDANMSATAVAIVNVLLATTSLTLFVMFVTRTLRSVSPPNESPGRVVLLTGSALAVTNVIGLYFCGFRLCTDLFIENVAVVLSLIIVRRVLEARAERK